jgi:hypothetical protein
MLSEPESRITEEKTGTKERNVSGKIMSAYKLTE